MFGHHRTEAPDGDVRVLMEPEDVLDRDEALHQWRDLLRVDLRQELQRIPQPLRPDPQAVIVGRRGALGDATAPLPDRTVPIEDQGRSGSQHRLS